jgi:parallel beta helix pectate lyase-like protein
MSSQGIRAAGRSPLHPLVAAVAMALMLQNASGAETARPPSRAFAPVFKTHPASANGHSIPVTSCDDSGSGSLRNAVDSAVSGDTVDLTQLGCSTITLTSGDIAIAQDDLSIEGPGAAALTVSGNDVYSVFRHSGSGTLAVRGLTIAHGRKYLPASANIDTRGGCIYSKGSVDAENVLIEHCYVGTGNTSYLGRGGAILASVGITLTNSTITASAAGGSQNFNGAGGAVDSLSVVIRHSTIDHCYAEFQPAILADALSLDYSWIHDNGGAGAAIAAIGNADIRNSTISANSQAFGAAVYLKGEHASYPLHIVNSTISGNFGRAGAGVQIGGPYPTVIANSTIAFNEAIAEYDDSGKYGAGIYAVAGATVSLQSTIVAENKFLATDNTESVDDIGGEGTFSGSNNLALFAVPPARLPSDTLVADPLLLALANNGGPTLTHALDIGSPAIDRGNDTSGQSNDQRGDGFARTMGSATDIGAYELNTDDIIFADGFDT